MEKTTSIEQTSLFQEGGVHALPVHGYGEVWHGISDNDSKLSVTGTFFYGWSIIHILIKQSGKGIYH